MHVSILPAGTPDTSILHDLASQLTQGGLEVTFLPPARLPSRAFDKLRGQYRASAFLGLARRYDAEYLLVVTDVDLYAERLNFVFGQAQVGGGAAVISLNRLSSEDRHLFVMRTLKEALHELGHATGLGHCDDERCVMHFSNTLADTDLKGPGYCGTCRSRTTTEALWDAA